MADTDYAGVQFPSPLVEGDLLIIELDPEESGHVLIGVECPEVDEAFGAPTIVFSHLSAAQSQAAGAALLALGTAAGLLDGGRLLLPKGAISADTAEAEG